MKLKQLKIVALEARVAELERVLRILRTWARFQFTDTLSPDGCSQLWPAHALKLIEKVIP